MPNPREVCEEKAAACLAFGQPTYTDQLGPDAALWSCRPVRSVGAALSCVSANFLVVWSEAAGGGDVGPAILVVCFVVAKGFERKLCLRWAIRDSWYRTDRLHSATSGVQGVVFCFDVVADERC